MEIKVPTVMLKERAIEVLNQYGLDEKALPRMGKDLYLVPPAFKSLWGEGTKIMRKATAHAYTLQEEI